jgi:hypothetical protein
MEEKMGKTYMKPDCSEIYEFTEDGIVTKKGGFLGWMASVFNLSVFQTDLLRVDGKTQVTDYGTRPRKTSLLPESDGSCKVTTSSEERYYEFYAHDNEFSNEVRELIRQAREKKADGSRPSALEAALN